MGNELRKNIVCRFVCFVSSFVVTFYFSNVLLHLVFSTVLVSFESDHDSVTLKFMFEYS